MINAEAFCVEVTVLRTTRSSEFGERDVLDSKNVTKVDNVSFNPIPKFLVRAVTCWAFLHPDIFLITVSSGPFLNFLLQKILNTKLKI